MTITSQTVLEKEFSVRFRGFDMGEVDSFLEETAESLHHLSEENSRLNDRLAALEQENREFREQEKTLKEAIISAQKVAEEIKSKGREEAERRTAEVRAEIEQSRRAAEEEQSRLDRQLREIRKMKLQALDDMRDLLYSYLKRLEEDLQAAAGEDAGPEAAPDETSGAGEDELADLYQKVELPDEPELSGSGGGAGEQEEERTAHEPPPLEDEAEHEPAVIFPDPDEEEDRGPRL